MIYENDLTFFVKTKHKLPYLVSKENLITHSFKNLSFDSDANIICDVCKCKFYFEFEGYVKVYTFYSNYKNLSCNDIIAEKIIK